jgi:hypothetical protein
MTFKTEQEEFWAGEFGNEYVDRNAGAALVASNTAMFSSILQNTSRINSVVEFGANIGLNLQALRILLPSATLTGIELNSKAACRLWFCLSPRLVPAG